MLGGGPRVLEDGEAATGTIDVEVILDATFYVGGFGQILRSYPEPTFMSGFGSRPKETNSQRWYNTGDCDGIGGRRGAL